MSSYTSSTSKCASSCYRIAINKYEQAKERLTKIFKKLESHLIHDRLAYAERSLNGTDTQSRKNINGFISSSSHLCILDRIYLLKSIFNDPAWLFQSFDTALQGCVSVWRSIRTLVSSYEILTLVPSLILNSLNQHISLLLSALFTCKAYSFSLHLQSYLLSNHFGTACVL